LGRLSCRSLMEDRVQKPEGHKNSKVANYWEEESLSKSVKVVVYTPKGKDNLRGAGSEGCGVTVATTGLEQF
jgi:hypothetical protein